MRTTNLVRLACLAGAAVLLLGCNNQAAIEACLEEWRVCVEEGHAEYDACVEVDADEVCSGSCKQHIGSDGLPTADFGPCVEKCKNEVREGYSECRQRCETVLTGCLREIG